MTAPLPIDLLGPRTQIGAGAYGVVYKVHSRVPGHGRVAYKEFKTAPPPDSVANLAALVDTHACMASHDQGLLGAATTWPVRLVSDGSQIRGFIMPLLGEAFIGEVRLPSGDV